MKVSCDYCGTIFEDTIDRCPSCGAANPKRNMADKKPRTIEELAQWYIDRNLPPAETTRFFIGRNYTQPKAFGIYRNEQGEFVVYKNKADGSRAIRYQGRDEEFAVNELYQKLKDEIVHQKNLHNHNIQSTKERYGNTSFSNMTLRKLIIFIAAVWLLPMIISPIILGGSLLSHRNDGYYKYYSTPYYKDGTTWYIYDDDYMSWSTTTEPKPYADGYTTDDYYMGKSYSDARNGWTIDETEFTDVKDSSSWDSNHTTSSYSSDSDYDWDSGSDWDSGGSDWDSDW